MDKTERYVYKYLYDILTSVRSVKSFLGEKRDFSKFDNNMMMKRAVEREFTIIGEATNKMLKLRPDVKVSHTKKIIGLRNRIVHSYDNITYSLLWEIISIDLPELEKEVLELLKGTKHV